MKLELPVDDVDVDKFRHAPVCCSNCLLDRMYSQHINRFLFRSGCDCQIKHPINGGSSIIELVGNSHKFIASGTVCQWMREFQNHPDIFPELFERTFLRHFV